MVDMGWVCIFLFFYVGVGLLNEVMAAYDFKGVWFCKILMTNEKNKNKNRGAKLFGFVGGGRITRREWSSRIQRWWSICRHNAKIGMAVRMKGKKKKKRGRDYIPSRGCLFVCFFASFIDQV